MTANRVPAYFEHLGLDLDPEGQQWPNHTKTWVYAPAKPKASEVPAALKADLEAKARRLIDEELKPKCLKPPPADDRFNYIADLYGRWYRHYFYFCARYNSPGPNAIAPFFEAKFTAWSMLAEVDSIWPSCATPGNRSNSSRTCRSTSACRRFGTTLCSIRSG